MKKGMVLMLALAIVGAAFLALPSNVSAQATANDWNVGQGWYFGKTVDFSEMQEEIDQGLQDLPPGFDADINVAGGVGVYFGVEVVDDDVIVNGYTCYQVDINGAVGIDFGLEAYVKGTATEGMLSIEIDADGSAVVVGEANLDSSLYFTVDELAFAKGEFTLTADAHANVVVDAFVDMHMDTTGFGGEVEDMTADINAEIHVVVDNVILQGSVECDPPLDFFDFPIYENDVWWAPENGTVVTTTWSAQGTIDVSADITGIPDEPDVHEHETRDLAVEIGSGTESYTTGYFDQVQFMCVAVYGNNYIIETSTGDFFDYVDWGTRQDGIDPLDMLPIDDIVPENAGVQYNSDSGFITGLIVDGEVMTALSDKDTVESFIGSALGDVQHDTGGHGTVGIDLSGPDGDGDGFLDEWEEILGTDPNDNSSVPLDTDGDGLPDGNQNNTELWMDTDNDNDGVLDTEDTYPLDSTRTGEADGIFPLILIGVIVIVVIFVVVITVVSKRKKSGPEDVYGAQQPPPYQPPPQYPPQQPPPPPQQPPYQPPPPPPPEGQ